MTITAIAAVALPFLKRFWKPIAVIVAVTVIYLWHQSAVTRYGNERFQAGVDATLSTAKETIATINKQNRDKEASLQAQIDAYGTKYGKDDAKRQKQEEKHTAKLNELLATAPKGCEISPEILAERNKIRALGPS